MNFTSILPVVLFLFSFLHSSYGTAIVRLSQPQNVSLALPYEMVLKQLEKEGPEVADWVLSIRNIYNDFLLALWSRSRKRECFARVKSVMAGWIERLIENVEEAYMLAKGASAEHLAEAFRSYLELAVWNFYYFGHLFPSLFESVEEHLADLVHNMEVLGEKSLYGRLTVQVVQDGIMLTSRVTTQVLTLLIPMSQDFDHSVIYSSLCRLFELYTITNQALATILRQSMREDGKQLPLLQSIVEEHSPFTTDKWTIGMLRLLETKSSFEDFAEHVAKGNNIRANQSHVSFWYHIPDTPLGRFNAFLIPNDINLPAPLLSIMIFRLDSDILPHLMANFAFIIPLSQNLLNIMSVMFASPLEFVSARNAFLGDLHKYGVFFECSSNMRLRLMRQAIISTFVDTVELYRTLFITNSLYIFPNITDRQSVTAYFQRSIIELDFIGRMHGRKSRQFGVYREFMLKLYANTLTFQIPCGLEPRNFIPHLF